MENWCDCSATVRYEEGPQLVRYLCADFFDKDSPVHNNMVRKNKSPAVDKIVTEVSAALQVESEQAKAGRLTIDEKLFETPNKERKTEQTNKARAARTVASEEKKKRRRVSLA